MNDQLKLKMILDLVQVPIPDLLILYGASTFADSLGINAKTDQGYPTKEFIAAIEQILDTQGVVYGKYEGSSGEHH